MNEEIDIIELLKRVKEGNAPKKIEIDGTEYKFMKDFSDIYCIYQTEDYDDWGENEDVTLDTKIKILDKPIIEELSEETTIGKEGSTIKAPTNMALMFKINEIIKWINEKN